MALTVPAWMKGTPLEQIYIDAWIETGDAALALEEVRQSSAYDDVFSGNRRDDGTIRYDENTYLGIIESFEDTLLGINVNPDLFNNLFPDLISGLVSPSEFNARVENLYEQILSQSQFIQDAYAAEYGEAVGIEAIVASFLDPDVGDAILQRRIAISQVTGEAASRSFTVGIDLAEKLVNYGVDTLGEAQGLFAEASNILPTLEVLAARHADPDDTFDITEFTNASIFGDPEQRQRIRRLLAQERSTFAADSALSIRTDESRALSGLQQT